jgi:GAF domain-containing protein
MSRGYAASRAVIDRQTIHIHDITEELAEFLQTSALDYGVRTILATPLLREGVSIGVIRVSRTEVNPFTEKQIALLKTFADQAVIAIENVRLFRELGERNAELREALEHQTATAEVLGIISRSPTDVQPVLDAIVESAAKVCGIDDVTLRVVEGNIRVPRAHFGPIPVTRGSISIDEPQFRWMREHGTLHVPDIRAQKDFPMLGSGTGARTFLLVPLRQQGELIGTLTARRIEVRPFTSAQIKLLETFADQAVIAIENVRLFQELKESLEQQTATSEILGVIASSPTDLQPVLKAVAENAARLCDASDAHVLRVDGDRLVPTAAYGPMPLHFPVEGLPISRGLVGGRAVIDRQTVHVHDMAAEPDTEFPDSKHLQALEGFRTILATPLLREGFPLGSIVIRRKEARPFAEKQIALLKTFADQAVIAIENVRLFKELQERNAELREALEHQTATSEVLGIISRSPTDVQPVLDAIVESAAKVCGIDDVALRLHERDAMIPRAHFGPIPLRGSRTEISIDEPHFRWMREHGALHISDVRAQNEFPMLGSGGGIRTFLAVPLRQQGELLGTLYARQTEVRPFTPAQIKLLETFADQAVIAIENVRLFKELQERNRDLTEALEQQTATSEVLKVISRSTFDLQPVLETLTENAVRLCGSERGSIYRFDGERLNHALSYNASPELIEFLSRNPITPGRNSVAARAALERRTIHVPDIQADPDYTFAAQQVESVRTVLGVPMLRGDDLLGIFTLQHSEVQHFTDRQIELVTTFADQAVIAIENVRLFQELKESLEQQTATSEILGVIASSPTDIQPVLDAVAESAARLCNADDAVIHRIDGDTLRSVANYGTLPTRRGGGLTSVDRQSIPGRTVIDRRTLHIHDLAAEPDEGFAAPFARSLGVRTVLSTPLFREEIPIGTIHIRRMEVRPFSDKQVKLLETFAAQAVIAIENVRLFQELEARTRELA